MMMSRIRKKLRQRVEIQYVKRTSAYYRLRFWWLHELRQLRAKRRVNGIVTKAEIKAVQRVLFKLRKDEFIPN